MNTQTVCMLLLKINNLNETNYYVVTNNIDFARYLVISAYSTLGIINITVIDKIFYR